MGVNSHFLNLDVDGTLASNSDTIVPSQKAIKTYIDTKDSNVVHKTGNETIAGTKTFSNNIIGNLTGQSDKTKILVETDTRNDNQNPKWYMDNYSKSIITEFKTASTLGLTGSYYQLQTYVPWGDSSGGYPTQIAINSADNTKIYKRIGTSNTSWGNWNQIALIENLNTVYIPQNYNGNVSNSSVSSPIDPVIYGPTTRPKGIFRSFNLLQASENKLYGADKGVKTGVPATITCTHSAIGENMFDGSYSGYFTSINPSTDFSAQNPFVFEVTCTTKFDITETSSLYLVGHRTVYDLKATAYKLEVAYAYNSTNGFSWGTLIDYSGEAVSILNKYYSLYYSGHGGSTSYHNIFGIRLTITGSTSTVFAMCEMMLLSTFGTEKITSSFNSLDIRAGGKVTGDITIPTNYGSFKGNLIGNVTGNADTATKATQDGDGNTISSTYLKLSGGTMTGNINWNGADSKVLGLQLNNNNTNMDCGWTWSTGDGAGFALRSTSYATTAEKGAFIFFARNGTSSTNTKRLIGLTSGSLTWDGNEILTAAIKGSANGVATLDSNTKVPVAQLPMDSTLSTSSTNPVENQAVTNALNDKVEYAMVIKEW